MASEGMSGYVGRPRSGGSGSSGGSGGSGLCHAPTDSFTGSEQPRIVLLLPLLLLWVLVSRHSSTHPAHSAIKNKVQLPTRLSGRTPLVPQLSPKHSLMKSQQCCDVTWEGIFQTRSTLTVSEKSHDCVLRWRRSVNEQLVTKLISSPGMKQVNRVVHFGNFYVPPLADAGQQR